MLEFIVGYSMGQGSASRAASLARSAAVADGTRNTNRIEDLQEDIERILVFLRAMWALLEEQGMTADQLIAKIEELDLADGVADGKVTHQVIVCPRCESKVAPRLTNCQICGAEVRPPEEIHPLG